jgi:hypothetical protein
MRPWPLGSWALEIHGRGTDGEGGSGYADRPPGFWPLACHFRLPTHCRRRLRCRLAALASLPTPGVERGPGYPQLGGHLLDRQQRVIRGSGCRRPGWRGPAGSGWRSRGRPVRGSATTDAPLRPPRQVRLPPGRRLAAARGGRPAEQRLPSPTASPRALPSPGHTPHGTGQARACEHGPGGEYPTLHGYNAADRRPGINVRHASAARHLRLFYELCAYRESGSPLEGLISPRPAHSPPPWGTSLGGTPTGTRISWRCGRVTGSRTRINGLPVSADRPQPGNPARGPPRQQRAVPPRTGREVLTASRPTRGRRAGSRGLPRLRGACRATARLSSADQGPPAGAGRQPESGRAGGSRRLALACAELAQQLGGGLCLRAPGPARGPLRRPRGAPRPRRPEPRPRHRALGTAVPARTARRHRRPHPFDPKSGAKGAGLAVCYGSSI